MLRLVLGFALVCSIASPAAAQTSDDAEAQQWFEAGRAAFENGRFDEALPAFRRSHELSGRPELLYNIAATLDRLRRDDEALTAYERYLAAVPDAPNRPEIEGRIRVLRGQAEEETRGPVAEPREQGSPPWGWAIGVTAAAAVLGGAALAFWLVGDAAYHDLETECAMGCTDERIASSNVSTFDVLTNVSLGVAAAAAIGAVVLFVIAGTSGGESDGPAVTARLGLGGLQIEGRL